ncbi:MAG: NAD-dependent epimerase/dehydratase family protein [Bacteroidetes bacterium]|nr:NAD-dependent epimerase/dehydratase family protein [Bacteroidota bacterium]
MNIAVTGASGHVGSCLCRDLLERGHHVRVLIYHDTKGIEGLDVQKIKGDMLDIESLKELCRDVDIVFHLAAKISIGGFSKADVFNTNVNGTKNIIQCCIEMGVKRMVHFSSIHAFRNNPVDKPLDETWPTVGSSRFIYDWSKAESEKVVLNAVSLGFDAVIINPTAVIGPYDFKPSYLGLAFKKMAANKLPMLVQGGYNWVDVRDVVKGAISAAIKGRRGEKYILPGKYMTLKEIALTIKDITGKKVPEFICPGTIAKIFVPFIEIFAKLRNEPPLYTCESIDILRECNLYIQGTKANNELDYTPRPIEETISDTIEWFNVYAAI